MLKSLTGIWLGLVLIHVGNTYYTSRRCYGTGDCHLMTKNQDGGFDDAKHQWLVECSDGEGVVAIRDDDSHFEGLSGLWCSFLFPLKQSSKGMYPYYPSCLVRNLTAGEYHCSGSDKSNQTSEMFVSGIYKEPNDKQIFVPSLMKCCEMPTDYQIDYTRCYYKKTFDRFGEHYTGEWLVKCDTHHLVTGIGKDVNPWDNKEHFTWIQCCPFYYTAAQKVSTSAQIYTKLYDQAASYDSNNIQPLLSDPGNLQKITSSGRTDYYPEVSGSGGFLKPAQLITSGPTPLYTAYKGQSPSSSYYYQSGTSSSNSPPPSIFSSESNNFGEVFGRNPPIGGSRYYTEPPTTVNLTDNQPISQGAMPVLEGPPMNAIQHYANVAAYHQFISTFNELLTNYTKQQKNAASANGYSGGPTIGGYTPLVYQSLAQPPISLAASLQTGGGSGEYVQPPLPSGLQNYMALTSPNPGETLASLYGQYSKSAVHPGTIGGTIGAAGYGTLSNPGQFGSVSGNIATLNPIGQSAQYPSEYGYGGGQHGGYGVNSRYGTQTYGDGDTSAAYVTRLQQQNQLLQSLLNSKSSYGAEFGGATKVAGEPTLSTLTVASAAGGNIELKTNGSLIVNLPANVTV